MIQSDQELLWLGVNDWRDFPERNEWPWAQQPWYLVMAPDSQLLLLYPTSTLFTCPLTLLSLQTSSKRLWPHPRHSFSQNSRLQQLVCTSLVTLCLGLGNITFRDLGRPFQKKATMPFRHSTENMYICPRAGRGRAHIPRNTIDGVQQKGV